MSRIEFVNNQSADEESPSQGEEAAAATAQMLPTPIDQHKKRKAKREKLEPTKSAKRENDSGDSGGEDAAFLVGLSAEEIAKMSRSERKRHREKKRRSDVNKGFDELMTLLLEIDPSVRAEAEERARRGQWKGQLGAHEDNLLSRVDLISRAVEVLRRIHRENEERKLLIASLTSGRAEIGAGVGAGAGFSSLGTNSGHPGASLASAGDEVRQSAIGPIFSSLLVNALRHPKNWHCLQLGVAAIIVRKSRRGACLVASCCGIQAALQSSPPESNCRESAPSDVALAA